jgi:hypothetical protein
MGFGIPPDADMLARHREMFDVPAFQVACIYGLAVREISEAIDDVSAALGTGNLYTRSGKLFGDHPASDYRSSEFRTTFSRIDDTLTKANRAVVDFERYFRAANSECTQHFNFYSKLLSFGRNTNREAVTRLIGQMDEIDALRNEILQSMNRLLNMCGQLDLPLIEVSSDILKKHRIDDPDAIACLLHLGKTGVRAAKA